MSIVEWNNGWDVGDWDDERFDFMVREMNERIDLNKVRN